MGCIDFRPAIEALFTIYGLQVYGKLQPKGPAMTEMVEDLVSSLGSNAA